MERDTIVHRVRTALRRTATDPRPDPPAVYFRIPEWDRAERIRRFTDALEALGGRVHIAPATAVAETVCGILRGRTALISGDPFLRECGIPQLPGVEGPFANAAEIRSAAVTADVGITVSAYGLAETGTLVVFPNEAESRLISLLPPAHVAVLRARDLLVNLDELLSRVPDPGAASSAMVMITGPSRTADIEQILVRGVHGPGEVHVVVTDRETE
jgi:L-lactate dehydrogenase complex protein LldG